jgi:hypothetical protein
MGNQNKTALTLVFAFLALTIASAFALAVPFCSWAAAPVAGLVGFFDTGFLLVFFAGPLASATFLPTTFLPFLSAAAGFFLSAAPTFLVGAAAVFLASFLSAGFFAAGLAAAGLAAGALAAGLAALADVAGFSAAGRFSAFLSAGLAAAGLGAAFFSAAGLAAAGLAGPFFSPLADGLASFFLSSDEPAGSRNCTF